jgi:hypothetical protein
VRYSSAYGIQHNNNFVGTKVFNVDYYVGRHQNKCGGRAKATQQDIYYTRRNIICVHHVCVCVCVCVIRTRETEIEGRYTYAISAGAISLATSCNNNSNNNNNNNAAPLQTPLVRNIRFGRLYHGDHYYYIIYYK